MCIRDSSKGVVESFKTMGHQIVDHPLDSLKGLALGLAADPELLFPGLWETAPEKLAASLAKVAKQTKTAEDIAAAAKARKVVDDTSAIRKVGGTTVKAAAVGAIAESTCLLYTSD